ncbi:MAG: hypothetical protein UT11_C0008G0002 [Berkelbacteria bacterium GW2011_GWA2_38_9]|uniref:Uncharacterized protein n=1 Tax=Berkelbacteria bacterium GW2011_GWA2_38_9 TaxID=1618334 RepID=A0A0G0NWU2_9BACT|nr:MAG: hypothetical protein UT11_C0008G0002 [Berkelbacteria bacterium GW2011_GWA2_38_9]
MIGKIRGRKDYERYFYQDGRPKQAEPDPQFKPPVFVTLLAICPICNKPKANWLCVGDLGRGRECGLVICESHITWRMSGNGHAVDRCPQCVSLHENNHRRLTESEEALKCPVCGILKSSLLK